MARATIALLTLIFVSGLLTFAGYDSIVVDIYEFFSDTGDTTFAGQIAEMAGRAIPIVLIGVAFFSGSFSGSSAFALAGFILVLPFVTFPYELFTTALVPVEVKFMFAGFYAIFFAMAGIGIMRGDV